MAEHFKARPTEYRGVVFRSKCEAMFARYLDMEHDELTSIYSFSERGEGINNTVGHSGGWVYEPKNLTVDGWTPDFLSWRCGPNSAGLEKGWLQIPYMHQEIIEYKPSRPTKTFCEELLHRFISIGRLLKSADYDWSNHTNYRLYWGSVYSDTSGLVTFDLSNDNQFWKFVDDCDWVVNWKDSILETRFDLEIEKLLFSGSR